MLQRLSAASAAVFIALAGTWGLGAAAQAAPEGAILYTDSPNAVPGRYIVVLKETAGFTGTAISAKAQQLSGKFGGQTRHVFSSGLRGFSLSTSAAQAKLLAADPAVSYVEQVQRISVQDTQNNPPNWGDDRVDQRNLPLNQAFTYPTNPGQGVTVYVLDTGLNASHVDFSGRVKQGTDIVDGDSNPADCHGHGTHTAGTAVGTSYGIAKKASVVSVRVLDCQGSGTNDDLIAGINWVRSNAQKPAVANYSIGCTSRCSSQAMDSAVSNLISSGVQFVQAAGNSGDDACYYSPQGVSAAITVGNSNSSDAKNSSSNYGSCLDIFAPGTSIVSASYSSNTGSATMTGTSMASPHVAGAAALYLGANPNATPAQVRDALVTNGTTGKITSPGSGSPNVLLYTGFIGGGTPGNPAVTNPGNQSTAVGGTANLQLQASGGTSPYTWSASGLPTGLSIGSSTGKVTGTASTAGTYNVTVTVTDSASKTGSAQFTWTVSTGGGCTAAQLIGNSGFESGTSPWTATANVIGQWSQYPARTGSRNAWLNGGGRVQVDNITQSVTIPSGCSNTSLSFWIRITTAETESVIYDKLTVTANGTSIATYSNLDKNSGYAQKTINLGAYAGQAVTLKFNGVEDSNLQTSFVIDDVTVNAS
ncbi:subtilisin family serine protease [Allocatelliglobosispora scoriae]|uniref:Subtilisin family serine protease n=1 Tax=Allocatelliglobosispora scoriae TaxID=643052 RepID=A0A841BYG9_9ACTN|nr:S8 family serine peptidase [Allocatelliglobosispora scoriae]MBB5872715.1 subtilisin family serine protease [Allocatelliglobosispora scoriae]